MLGTLIIVRNPPQIAGMPASRLGASAVEVGVNQNLAAQYAKRTKAEKYGIYLMYNLREKIHLRISRRRHKNFMVEKRTIHQLFQHLNYYLVSTSANM